MSGTVVAALLAVLASVFLLWRRARSRAAAGAALSLPPAGARWPKSATLLFLRKSQTLNCSFQRSAPASSG